MQVNLTNHLGAGNLNISRAMYKPRLLAIILALKACCGETELRCDEFAEFFAGVQSITGGFRCHGFTGVAFDTKYGPQCDFLTINAFAAAVLAILKIRCGGVLWVAPPCSSWVWMSRSSTGRP